MIKSLDWNLAQSEVFTKYIELISFEINPDLNGQFGDHQEVIVQYPLLAFFIPAGRYEVESNVFITVDKDCYAIGKSMESLDLIWANKAFADLAIKNGDSNIKHEGWNPCDNLVNNYINVSPIPLGENIEEFSENVSIRLYNTLINQVKETKEQDKWRLYLSKDNFD